MSKKIIIIGGGAIGISCAYFLLLEGHQVTIIDDSKKNDNCSYGNAGMIVPSHFTPLASPGVIWQGIKWMFKPDSPFSIKANLNPHLIEWLWKFYWASNHNHVKNSIGILSQLNLQSRNLFEELNEYLNFGFESRGLLMLANTPKGLKKEIETVELAKQTAIQAELLEIESVKQLLPDIQLNIEGGIYFKQDAHITPASYMYSLKNYLKENGAELINGESLIDFKTKGSSILAVETNKDSYSADEFILAAGAWSHKLVKNLGLKLPVIAGKGYSLSMPKPVKQLQIPTILSEGKVAITPMGESLRFAGTMELTGTNLSIKKGKITGLINTVGEYLPDYDATHFEDIKPWVGLRPASSDGLPLIGRFNKYPNLIAATGHTMMGISLAPVTGKIIEEIVNNKTHSMDLSRVNVNR